MAEYRRLLYVALTRAEDRLIVAGARPARSTADCPPGCWYDLVRAAWGPGSSEETSPEGDVRFVRHDGRARGAAPARAAPATPTPRPAWATPAPAAPPGPRRVAPSSVEDDTGGGSGVGRAAAIARGRVLHALFQHVPRLPPERRAAAARAYVASALPGHDADALAAEALAVIEAPDNAALFAVEALAEAPIVGRARLPSGGEVEVSGQIDRLAMAEGRVILADFKTGARPARVPRAYLAQMALYRALLATLHPGRAIACRLIWTREAIVDELAEDDLDAALAAIPSS